MASLNLTVVIGEDVLRLTAYRMVLRSIAERGAVPVWERDDDEPEAHEMAEAALRAMGEWEDNDEEVG